MNKNRLVWEKPWKYKEGIIISLTLLMLGFALEYSSNGSGVVHLINYPNNLYFGGGFILLIIAISVFGKQWAIKQWLENIPAAICSIGLLLLVSLLMGITLQFDDNAPTLIKKLGLSHVVSSWPYLFANMFLLLSLGMVIIKTLNKFKWQKAGYIVSHLGLWIVLFAANFGSSQLLRLQMEIPEGEISNVAYDNATKSLHEMPFAIKLNDFILEEYNPKLAVVNNKSGKLRQGKGKNMILVDSAVSAILFDWQIIIEDYIYSSARAGDNYYFHNERGAVPSVLIKATDKNGAIVRGWVTCGSFNKQYQSLKLDDDYSLIMLFPEPKEFTSNIDVIQKNGNHQEINLQVNKPFKTNGWKIYQLNYDSELGRWSDVSVIELIRDPWLPVVYTGVFLMLAGALFLFWVGSKNKTEKSK